MGARCKQMLDSNGFAIQALMPLIGGTQVVADGNASTAVRSNVVRLVVISGTPRIAISSDETAAGSDDMLLISDVPEYFSIPSGWFIAVADGTVEITEFVTGAV